MYNIYTEHVDFHTTIAFCLAIFVICKPIRLSEFARSGAADHSGVKNLSGLTIEAQVDSPGRALTVGGWPTTAEKSIGVGRGPK